MKIVGNTVGTTMPRPNLMQTDPQKGDYVHGREEFLGQLPDGPSGGGFVVSDTPPEDTSLLWVDTSDESGGIDLPTDDHIKGLIDEALDEFEVPSVEIPTNLPNPHALTFTGAVSATYDGSEAVSVDIPLGGGGGGVETWDLLINHTIAEDCVKANFSKGDNGELFNDYRELIVLVDVFANANGRTTAVKANFENTNPWVESSYEVGVGGFGSDKTEYRIGILWCRKTAFGIIPINRYRGINTTSRSHEMTPPTSLTSSGINYFNLPVAENTHLTNTTAFAGNKEFKCVTVGGYQDVLGAGTIIRVYGCK